MSVILTYNVNGIRAALRKDFDKWLKSTNADIVCLQEIKANTQQFDESVFTDLGYYCYWNSAEKKGYSGVAILTKTQPNFVEYGCGIENIDFEGLDLKLNVLQRIYKKIKFLRIFLIVLSKISNKI